MSKPTSALVTFSQVTSATGYKVFWGTTSHTYPYSQDIGANLNYRVKGLRRGRKYYFTGKSYNASHTSAYGNEVAFTP